MCMTVVITAFALVYFIFAVGLPILAILRLKKGESTYEKQVKELRASGKPYVPTLANTLFLSIMICCLGFGGGLLLAIESTGLTQLLLILFVKIPTIIDLTLFCMVLHKEKGFSLYHAIVLLLVIGYVIFTVYSTDLSNFNDIFVINMEG